ncbi:PREDICTED: COX assembly mitochondrial protein 2 homolog isoform X1 [Chinchilla lanigera]|uniref:COX assembly mitochondrial protein 2 homolog isoform X1 n=1 Tax=Chinchilla lanigera TaxID=34839 RepID=UPI0006988F3B|nr:PREDICTED: COX assembly mitochondrial protein 2 homolog isoform X1 [Chinchilla lanigera]
MSCRLHAPSTRLGLWTTTWAQGAPWWGTTEGKLASRRFCLVRRRVFVSEGQHGIRKFFGHCNDLDRQMRKCLKNEYMEKRTRSREHGNEMRKRLFNPLEGSEK